MPLVEIALYFDILTGVVILLGLIIALAISNLS